eukprot:1391500-Amorphochlora_amoeboformis.AAC.1
MKNGSFIPYPQTHQPYLIQYLYAPCVAGSLPVAFSLSSSVISAIVSRFRPGDSRSRENCLWNEELKFPEKVGSGLPVVRRPIAAHRGQAAIARRIMTS